MKDEYKIHDENLINELLDANAKMRELLEKAEAERDEALTWVAHFQECSRDECMCGSKMNPTCGHGGCVSTAEYHAFPNAKRELKRRDLEQQIKALDGLEDGLEWSGDMGCLVVTSQYIADRTEQLRKEIEK